ncbi:MAG: 16S rRNA (adenine(1518)-N(6)/adenine(1519)-N(6))-dimethyltransferase RsmA [Candidatus Aureabacteria bacterium]|nr:16S rRNA (adenine(1518)-N(6)/adenine(1519)-N(6))-dimethyltransferase RsmA [Candidatus Auribacterota bacterium]
MGRRGQSFLVSEDAAKRIVDLAEPAAGESILEIGAGLGALTAQLLGRGCRTTVVENDRRLASWLRERFKGRDSFELIEGDILEIDLAGLLGRIGSRGPVKVVSNIPYSISGPLMGRLLEHGRLFSILVLTLQKELAQRITSGPGRKEYGAFSIFCQYHAEVTRIFDLPPSAFYPRPAVVSSVVVVRPGREPRCPVAGTEEFFSFIRMLFSQRRKKLATVLKRASKDTAAGEKISSVLRESGVDPGCRAEDLTLEELARIHGRCIAAEITQARKSERQVTSGGL